MLGIDNGTNATLLLSLSYNMYGQGGLTGRFRTENLGDSSAGKPPNSQGIVKPKRAGRYRLYILHGIIAESHHSADTEILLQMTHSHLESFQFGILI